MAIPSNTRMEMIKTILSFPDNDFFTSKQIRTKLPHLSPQVISNNMNVFVENESVTRVSTGQFALSNKEKMFELFDVEIKNNNYYRALRPTTVLDSAKETERINRRLNQIDALYAANSILGPKFRELLLEQINDAMKELGQAKRKLNGRHTVPRERAILHLEKLNEETTYGGKGYLESFAKDWFPDSYEEHIKVIHDFIKGGPLQ